MQLLTDYTLNVGERLPDQRTSGDDHDVVPGGVQADLVPGTDPEEAADWLARNVLSFLMAAGGWDLDDSAEVRRLVRDYLLAGILA